MKMNRSIFFLSGANRTSLQGAGCRQQEESSFMSAQLLPFTRLELNSDCVHFFTVYTRLLF